jgi:hypothetical protein
MFDRIKISGILLREMKRRTDFIAVLSFIIGTLPFIIISSIYMSKNLQSIEYTISSSILLWYFISLIMIKRVDLENIWGKLFTFPVFISLLISVLIFRFFLKQKYPEIEEEYYDRWLKLKNLQRKIKKRKKYLFIN